MLALLELKRSLYCFKVVQLLLVIVDGVFILLKLFGLQIYLLLVFGGLLLEVV